MAQQYSYGYGYGYPTTGTVGYGVNVVGYATPPPTLPPRPAQPATYQPSPYSTPKSVAPLTPQQQQQQQQTAMNPVQTSSYQSVPTANVPQTTPPSSYYTYQQTQQQQQQYRPTTQQQQQSSTITQLPQTSYAAGYYQQQQQQQQQTVVSTMSTVKAVAATPPTSVHQGVGYGSSAASMATLPSIAYPTTYSTQYYSPAAADNRYGSYGGSVKSQSAVKPAVIAVSTPSYTPSSASYATTDTYSSTQEKVIVNYIAQKTGGGGGGGGGGGKYPGKKLFNTTNQAVYFCEVCKISCASSMTYKTHLEGKSHKKKLASQQANGGLSGEGGGTGANGTAKQNDKPYFCALCEVQCTSKDSYESHIRGTRHTKVLNLYRRLGKPIPEIKLPAGSEIVTTVGGKKVSINAPRIQFVGGQQLTSTGAAEKASPSLYPPTTVGGSGNTQDSGEGQGGGEGGEGDIQPEIEPVGEQFVIAVVNDPKFPHASYKCTMCDCYFNDEWAKKAHAKGRRHRLNYKKLHQPDLYVEPSKSNKKKAGQQRERRNSQGGGVGGRGRDMGGNWGVGRGGGQQQVDVESLRRQEAEELSKLQAGNNIPPPTQEMEQEYYMEAPPVLPSPPGPHVLPHHPIEPPSHFYPSRPRNPRDDRLVMNKHGSICPLDSEVKAVEQAVNDVEIILKAISDDILDEECKRLSEEQGQEVSRDEKHRKLKGVMRVGAFARSLMLRGECSVDLVLMCIGKPTLAFFNDIVRRMPEKFEELSSELVYNVSEDAGKAAILVISQVEDHRVQVTLTLTSTDMRNLPSPEEAEADKEAGVLHHPSCLAALAALRHTKWFQMMVRGLPSCSILMRVLKDICRRVPAWGVLDSWILELLVQRSLSSANPDYTRPGDVFRRVMECVASGVFLPGGTGLQDPCEKGLVDASACLTAQERVNITLSAQHALRLIAFCKAHLVLGVDPLPPPGTPRRDVQPTTVTEGDKLPMATDDGEEADKIIEDKSEVVIKTEVKTESETETEGEPEAKRPRVEEQ